MAQVKRVHPIKGRKDFYKYTIVKTGESIFNDDAELHTDFKGNEMYFDCKDRAQEVCTSINKVQRILKKDAQELTIKDIEPLTKAQFLGFFILYIAMVLIYLYFFG